MSKSKLISVVIPTYNEEENVIPLAQAIIAEFEQNLTEYQYEILFIDNHSADKTQERITLLCAQNDRIKAIFNAKNFGQFNSPYYALCQASGDAVILMCADFQDPIDMIPRFVSEWEQGHKIVCGIKSSSKENGLMYFLRSCYYKTIKAMSNVEQIEHFTGFGLYDVSFIEVLRSLDDSTPFLRGIVAELGFSRKEIPYTQARRRAGKTSNNLFRLFDAAMLSFTSYTKVGMRMATFFGFLCSAVSFFIALGYLVAKLLFWNFFMVGTAPLLIGVFFMGGIQLFFIGLLGEYTMSINARVMKRPLVIEERRINFASQPTDEKHMQS